MLSASRTPSEEKQLDLSGKPFFKLNFLFAFYPNLEILNLSNTKLKFLPRSLYDLHNLKYLDISNNEFEYIPPEIGSLEKLETLKTENIRCIRPTTWTTLLQAIPNGILGIMKFIMTPPSVPRPRKYLDFTPNSKPTFSIMTYNTLAPHLTNPTFNCFTPQAYLDPSNKMRRLFVELAQLNNDIICLQEIEARRFRNEVSPVFSAIGYMCFYIPKGYYDTLSDADQATCNSQAIFIRKSKFTILKSIAIRYSDFQPALQGQCDDTALIVIAQIKGTQHTIAVCNVHLTYKHNHVDQRTTQINITTNFLKQEMSSIPGTHDILIVGDFNCESYEPCHAAMRSDQFVSAYDYLGKTPEWTKLVFYHYKTIDFIYSQLNQIEPVSVLETYSLDEMADCAISLPSLYFPSDHIPISAIYQMK